MFFFLQEVTLLDSKVQQFVEDAQKVFDNHGRVIESQFLFKFKKSVGYLPKVREYVKQSRVDIHC